MKRKIIHMAMAGFCFFSLGKCGCDDDGSPDPDKIPISENQAPTEPSPIYPSNNLLCLENNLEFKWGQSSDPENDALTYYLEISDSRYFTNIEESKNTTNTSINITLARGEAFYWRIRAKDSKGLYSPWSTTNAFYTEGDGEDNHLPFAPSVVSPVNDGEIQAGNITLQWTCADVDGDVLKYDVYCGTTENPVLVSENQTENTFEADATTSATYYYWKIVAKDDKGGITFGQIWYFYSK